MPRRDFCTAAGQSLAEGRGDLRLFVLDALECAQGGRDVKPACSGLGALDFTVRSVRVSTIGNAAL